MSLFTDDQALDNYMVNESQFLPLCLRARVLPLVDMCADVLGTNSMCPFFYSAREDATQQTFFGVPAWCNPPFSDFDRFVKRLEAAREADPGTQAVLVLP